MSGTAPTPSSQLTLGPASPNADKASPSAGRGPMPMGESMSTMGMSQGTSSSSNAPWALPSAMSNSQYSQSDLASLAGWAGASISQMSKSDLIIIGTLGCGTYGRVDKVKRKLDGKICVCKEVTMEQFNSQKDLQQALSEAKIMCGLRCPYIVEFLDAFLEGCCLYILIEYCGRGDLARYLKKASVLPDSSIWRIFLRIARALEYLHSNQILHRDVKSANVFLARNDEDVRLGDFGQSKQMQPGQKGCSTIVGSPSYMAPEQVSLPGHYDEKCDAWALGIILYELCSANHKSPFSKARNITDLMRAIVNDDVPPLPKHITDQLKEVSNSMLLKDNTKRSDVTQLFSLRTVIKHAKQHKVFTTESDSDSSQGGGVAPARRGCCACLARCFGLPVERGLSSRNNDEPDAMLLDDGLEGEGSMSSISPNSIRSAAISDRHPHVVIYNQSVSDSRSYSTSQSFTDQSDEAPISPPKPSSETSHLPAIKDKKKSRPLVEIPLGPPKAEPSSMSSTVSRDLVLYNGNALDDSNTEFLD